MPTQSEATLEKELIDKLSSEGYEKVNINNEEDLENNFKTQIEKFNKCSLSDDEFRGLLIYLKEGSIFDKAKKLRDRYYVDRENESFYIKFLNDKNWCKNIFQVTNQVTVNGKYENRYDVTILINGLPLVQVELKKRGMPLKATFNQIKRYIRHSYKGLFNYIQIFVISNGVDTKYFSNNNFEPKFEFTFFWKDEKNRNITNIEEFAETFLERCNLAKMISQYMVLNESSKSLMVLRAYQKFAVEAVLNQALEVKQNGYIWHTTGSGKTLTSFKVSQLLAKEPSIDKVIFVVDRKDLDIQTNKEFNSFCKGCVDTSDKTRVLVKNLLSSDSNLITTTIQKLNNAIKKDASKLESIRDKNIIFIFDECHRSQFGEWNKNINEFFQNSLSFGFTGTPIFRQNAVNQTTKDIFKKRLHDYMIKDAINDGNVLGFSIDYYGGAKINEFEDYEVKNIDKQESLESENRLNQIVDDIIKNFDKKTRNRQYNALFAVSQGGIIHKYYELFKKKNHDLKVATIFTFDDNEDIDGDKQHSRDLLESYIKDYNKMFGTNFNTNTFNEYYADVSKRMKNKEIDLLLVVDMFLTGFDSKSLNTLYVDKNLKYHKLLQAFSRTNRIVDQTKSQGNIVCYRNLKNDVDESISLFSNEAPIEDIIIPEYEFFVKSFNETCDKLYSVVKTVSDVDDLESEESKKHFISNFKELSRIKNKLDIFTEFTFNDLKMGEQEFVDFKSKYLDLYDEICKINEDSDKESILEDIDFELELFRNDTINVDYILELLKDLDNDSTSFKKDKERIINVINQNENLRSKLNLIEKFINENIGQIPEDKTVREEFYDFMEREKRQELCNIVDEFDLFEENAREIFNKYEFAEKFADSNELKRAFKQKYKFLEGREVINNLKNRIIKLYDKFSY